MLRQNTEKIINIFSAAAIVLKTVFKSLVQNIYREEIERRCHFEELFFSVLDSFSSNKEKCQKNE